MLDDLGPAVNLNVLGAVKLLAKDEQRNLRIAADVFDLVSAPSGGDDHVAVRADDRRHQGHLQGAILFPRHQNSVMGIFQELLCIRNLHCNPQLSDCAAPYTNKLEIPILSFFTFNLFEFTHTNTSTNTIFARSRATITNTIFTPVNPAERRSSACRFSR